MTKITITKLNNNITELECDGHTGYGVSGEDIVCSALSSITQTAVLGVVAVAGVNANVTRDDHRGYLKLTIPDNITSEQRHDVNVILETMLCGVGDLYEGYSDFIELEVIDNVY
jgi:uncharacterized protein YsxB (DUF464 family)